MQETLIVLVVFVAFAVLFQRLRLGTVLGPSSAAPWPARGGSA